MANVNFSTMRADLSPEVMGGYLGNFVRGATKAVTRAVTAPGKAVGKTVGELGRGLRDGDITRMVGAPVRGATHGAMEVVRANRDGVTSLAPATRPVLGMDTIKQAKKKAREKLVARYLHTINTLSNQIVGGDYSKIRGKVIEFARAWDNFNKMGFDKTNPNLWKPAYNKALKTYSDSFKVWAADVNNHMGVMDGLLKSNDLKLVAEKVRDYLGWTKYMTGNQILPVTKNNSAYPALEAKLKSKFNDLVKHGEKLLVETKRRQENLEASLPTLLKLLKLPMNSNLNEVMSVFNSHILKPKDAEKYNEILKTYDLNRQSPFDKQLPAMIEFLKKKRLAPLKIVVPVAAGAAGLFLATR